MAHLHHVKLVRVDRIGGKDPHPDGAAGQGLATEPPGQPTEHKGGDDRRDGDKRPAPLAARQSAEVEPRRNRLLRDYAVARVGEISLGPPSGDTRSILRMRGKPRLDRRPPLSRKFAVHIGVRLVFEDRPIAINHRFALFT